MNRGRWVVSVLLAASVAATAAPAAAAPYRPANGGEVLEQLPERSSPALADLKMRRVLLARLPDDERVATRFARQAITAARTTGDPRYLGQAQAALGPWWAAASPPAEILLLRATIRQSRHDFAAALSDLDRLLAGAPDHAQARLTRATVRAARGHYADAQADCGRLAGRVDELVVATCAAAAAGPDADPAGYHRVAAALAASPASGALRAWAQTLAGELAARGGEGRAAEDHFRAALAQDPGDAYAKGAFADFLLDAGRHAEVIALLDGDTRNDALLLRLAQAEKALSATSERFRLHAGWLADRFAAARRRGDDVHLREEARYALAIEGDARRAALLARRNFELQREAADVQLLLAAGAAAGDAGARDLAANWIRAHQPPPARKGGAL